MHKVIKCPRGLETGSTMTVASQSKKHARSMDDVVCLNTYRQWRHERQPVRALISDFLSLPWYVAPIFLVAVAAIFGLPILFDFQLVPDFLTFPSTP